MKRRHARQLAGSILGLAVVGILTASCSGATENPGANPSTTAVFQIGSTGTGMNPDTSTNEFDTVVGCIVYEGLTKSGKDGDEPALADSWDVTPDGLKYTFHLKTTKWQDGQPFTSADVKYTYENVSMKYGPVWDSLKDVFDRVDTPDEHTAVIHLKRPYAPFMLQTHCDQNGAILPKHIFDGTDPLTNKATTSAPVGTGPFSLTNYTPDQQVDFKRNPDFHEPGLPKLDNLVGKIIEDPNAALNALRTGEVDYIVPLAFNQVKPISTESGLKVQEVPSGNVYQAFLNVTKKPLSDPKVRQALFRAVNMDYITDKVFFGTGRSGASAIPTSNFAYSSDVDYSKMYSFDPDKANAELDAAGYSVDATGNRFDLEIVVTSSPPTTTQIAELLKSFWSAVHVNVTVAALPDAAQSERVFTKRDFDVTIQGYTDFSDPAIGVSRSYTCSTVGKVYGNPSGYCDPALDKLWATAATTPEVDKRKALYADISKKIATVVPVLPLHEYNTFVGLADDLNIAIPANSYTPEWASATKGEATHDK